MGDLPSAVHAETAPIDADFPEFSRRVRQTRAVDGCS